MPVYAYKGVNAREKKVSGIVDADSAKAARQKLRKMQVYPLELTETVEKQKPSSRIGQALSLSGGVSSKDLAATTRQLATLVGAQLPLVQCLGALVDQVEDPKFKNVLAETREAVNEGASLADAMGAYPKIFSDLYVNMIRSGEQSGALDVVLQRLADFTEAQADLKNKVLFAMIYPTVVMGIMAIVVAVMFKFVIPKITIIFEQTKQTLPIITRVVIGLSDFLKGPGGLLVLVVLIGSFFGMRYYVRTPSGREWWHNFLLKLPVIGKITRNIAISRFCKTLSTLLLSGVPLLRAMEIVEKVVSNEVLAQAIHTARENITEGASIADPLKASGVFPPFVIQMIASGEQSGELEFMLEKVSEAFDREVEYAVDGLTKIIEPVMILFLAGMVVIVIVSFLLPILDLTSGLGF